jgi:hypothetical protein
MHARIPGHEVVHSGGDRSERTGGCGGVEVQVPAVRTVDARHLTVVTDERHR